MRRSRRYSAHCAGGTRYTSNRKQHHCDTDVIIPSAIVSDLREQVYRVTLIGSNEKGFREHRKSYESWNGLYKPGVGKTRALRFVFSALWPESRTDKRRVWEPRAANLTVHPGARHGSRNHRWLAGGLHRPVIRSPHTPMGQSPCCTSFLQTLLRSVCSHQWAFSRNDSLCNTTSHCERTSSGIL